MSALCSIIAKARGVAPPSRRLSSGRPARCPDCKTVAGSFRLPPSAEPRINHLHQFSTTSTGNQRLSRKLTQTAIAGGYRPPETSDDLGLGRRGRSRSTRLQGALASILGGVLIADCARSRLWLSPLHYSYKL